MFVVSLSLDVEWCDQEDDGVGIGWRGGDEQYHVPGCHYQDSPAEHQKEEDQRHQEGMSLIRDGEDYAIHQKRRLDQDFRKDPER